MVTLNLTYVDELINARQAQHGGVRGAPRLQGGVRIGASINRSVIVMLSAMLQSYVEDVFTECARVRFPELANDPQAFEAYWKQMKNWGNPSDGNIKNLFVRIGVPDVFAGLSWQRTTTAEIRQKLNELNQVRNDIAHGAAHIRVNNEMYSLNLVKAQRLRNFAEVFGQRFEAHAMGKI